MTTPVHVTVTGAAGQIGLLAAFPRIASVRCSSRYSDSAPSTGDRTSDENHSKAS